MHVAQNTGLNACTLYAKNAFALVHARICSSAEAYLPWNYCELILSLARASCRLSLPPALLLSRLNLLPDAVCSKNPSKSMRAHDAVAAALSHKHYSIIDVTIDLKVSLDFLTNMAIFVENSNTCKLTCADFLLFQTKRWGKCEQKRIFRLFSFLYCYCWCLFNNSTQPPSLQYPDLERNRTGDISPSWGQPNTKVHICTIEAPRMPVYIEIEQESCRFARNPVKLWRFVILTLPRTLKNMEKFNRRK